MIKALTTQPFEIKNFFSTRFFKNVFLSLASSANTSRKEFPRLARNSLWVMVGQEASMWPIFQIRAKEGRIYWPHRNVRIWTASVAADKFGLLRTRPLTLNTAIVTVSVSDSCSSNIKNSRFVISKNLEARTQLVWNIPIPSRILGAPLCFTLERAKWGANKWWRTARRSRNACSVN